MIRLNCNRALRTSTVLLAVLSLLAPAARGADPAPLPDGHAAMAEHFAQLAQLAVSTRAITPETLRQSVALLKAATRLNPTEVRFARLLAEAALQAGDTDTAYDAYKAVTKLDANDVGAQLRLIDLHAARQESADKRLEYLNGVYTHDGFAAEVRAHAAFVAAQTHFERAEASDAMRMLDEALRLAPLSPEALNLKFQLTGGGATPRERVALLLQMLRSNPAQPGVLARVGQELADVGMQDESLSWYNAAFNLGRAVGRGVTTEDFGRYAAQLVITGNAPTARQLATTILAQNARDVEAAMLNVLLARRGGDEEALKQAMTAAEQALILRAMNVGEHLRGEAPTTQPSATQPVAVDVPGDIKRLQEAADPALLANYSSTLADLAWLRVYFQQQPQQAAQVIAQLRQLLPPDSVTLARLEGWAYLVAGQTQEAQSKLSAVADRDPLAQLGMIALIEKDNPERATEEARKLMDANPSGLLGAIIHDALRDKRLKLPAGQKPPLSPAAEAVKAELDQFPKDWLDFIDKPQAFYAIRAEPLQVAHHYGEPIIARIIVQNLGEHDITIGPDGAIRPDLWFDVQVRGAFNDFVPGVAFDRLTQQVLLKPRQAMEQTVRVDQDRLLQMMQANASATLPLYFFVVTNPIATSVNIAPGPGGQRQSFHKTIQRVGLEVGPKALQHTLMTTLGELSTGTAEQKLRALHRLGWFATQFSQSQDEQVKGKTAEVVGAMHRATNDPSAVVRAWAGYVMARLPVLSDEQRQSVLKGLLEDPAWEGRMIGVLLVQASDPAQWKALAGPLAEGAPEPLVREFADAVVDFADNPAATQPASTTQPADGAGSDQVTSGQP
jgi:tetratricopeptide (TPR) repeat protein